MGWDDWGPIGATKNAISDAGDATSTLFNAAKDKTTDITVDAIVNTAEGLDNVKDFSVGAFQLQGAITRFGIEKTFDFTQNVAVDVTVAGINKFNDVKNFISGIDTTPGASNPPAAQGLEFSETKGASDLAYNAKLGEVYKFPNGKEWKVVDVQESEGTFENGFRAIALQNGDDVIVAYAGTDPKSPGDIATDLAQGIGFAPSQYKSAVAFADKWKAKAGAENVTLSGHSLGGGLAAYASIKTNLKATTVNSAPLALTNVGGNPFSDKVRNNPNITHYYVPGEVLSVLDATNRLDMRPGNKIAVEGNSPVYDPLAIFKNHSLGSVAPDIGTPTLVK